MTLLQRIKDRLEFENVLVSEETTTAPGGRQMVTYSVNKSGVVFMFGIPVDETDEEVIEDFLEAIEAEIQMIGRDT